MTQQAVGLSPVDRPSPISTAAALPGPLASPSPIPPTPPGWSRWPSIAGRTGPMIRRTTVAPACPSTDGIRAKRKGWSTDTCE